MIRLLQPATPCRRYARQMRHWLITSHSPDGDKRPHLRRKAPITFDITSVATLLRKEDQFGSSADAELVENLVEMDLHRPFGEAQFAGDFLVA